MQRREQQQQQHITQRLASNQAQLEKFLIGHIDRVVVNRLVVRTNENTLSQSRMDTAGPIVCSCLLIAADAQSLERTLNSRHFNTHNAQRHKAPLETPLISSMGKYQ